MRKINASANWRLCQSHSPMAATPPRVKSLANRRWPWQLHNSLLCSTVSPLPWALQYFPTSRGHYCRNESDPKLTMFSRMPSLILNWLPGRFPWLLVSPLPFCTVCLHHLSHSDWLPTIGSDYKIWPLYKHTPHPQKNTYELLNLRQFKSCMYRKIGDFIENIKNN